LVRTTSAVISGFAIWTALAGTVAAETRAAIVVGNSAYSGQALVNPRNDAALMAQTLQELGFDVSLYLDVTAPQSPLLEDQIRTKLSGADVAVLYFAGHGLQYKGENLLLPVDTDLTSVAGISEAGIPLSDLLEAVTSGAEGIKIIILDACRNPLVEGDDDELRSGFNFVEAPSGEVLIAFSTGAGEVAFDSAGGQNSPYTTALVNALQQSGSDIYDVFRSVRRSVRSGTGGQQIPWITGSIETDYVFRPSVEVAAVGADTAGPSGPVVVKTVDGEVLSVDRVLWEYLQSSSDPADFERFVEVFPTSPFATSAKERAEFQLASIDGETLTRDGINLSTQEIANEVIAGLPDTPEEGARTSLLLDQSGEYVMRDSFRTWPLALPETAEGVSSMATACDEEASDPLDPYKVSPGISEGNVNVRNAVRACAFDLAVDPENPRLIFQFARVLDIVRRHDWANAYYDRAAELAYPAAMVNRGFNAKIGRGQERDLVLSAQLYRRAALLGNLRGRTNFGNAFLRGEGVEKNPEEGILWLQLAASMGWPHAVNALGDAYRNGTGLEKDRTEAVALYRSAAEQGQTTAMANLGVAYLNGQGVEKDVLRGMEWLDRAIDLGNGFAPVYAGRFYLEGSPELPADAARAKDLFEAATRRGNVIGYLDLAKGFEQGQFPEGANPVEAYRNALFAEAGRVKGFEEVLERTAAALSPDQQAAIKAEVVLFLEQNGL
jgi:hypothetical protein